MRWLVCLLVACAVGSAEEAGGKDVAVAFEWRQLHGGPSHDNYRKRENRVLLPKVLWHRPEAVGQPTIREGWIHAGGPVLGRIAAATGKFERSPLADARAVGATPVLTDDYVIVRRPSGEVQAFTPDLRRLIWTHGTNAPDVHLNHPAAWHGEYYLINAGPSIRALRVRDGKEAWWFRNSNGEIAMTPVVADGRVFFAGVSGDIWSLELKSGKRLWHVAGRAQFGWSIPVVGDGVLLLADRGVNRAGEQGRAGVLHAFAVTNGAERWSHSYGQRWASSLGLDPDRVVIGTIRSVLMVDRTTGKEIPPRIAFQGVAVGAPTIRGTTLYFGTNTGYLHAHDLRTGALRWRLHIPGAPPKKKAHDVRSIVHTGDRIYVETTNGLYCLVQDPNRRGVRPQGETIEAEN